MYHLTLVGKVSIPNLRPLGPPLHVEKFVWWVGGWWWWVCKVILVFALAQDLGLRLKTWAKLNNIFHLYTDVVVVDIDFLFRKH